MTTHASELHNSGFSTMLVKGSMCPRPGTCMRMLSFQPYSALPPGHSQQGPFRWKAEDGDLGSDGVIPES